MGLGRIFDTYKAFDQKMEKLKCEINHISYKLNTETQTDVYSTLIQFIWNKLFDPV